MVLIKAAAVLAIIASANAFLQPVPMAIKTGEKLVTVYTFEHGSCSDARLPARLHAAGTLMHMSHKHSEPAELVNNFSKVDFESIERTFDQSHRNRALGATAAAMLPFLINVGEASAKGGELGIWEGRTAALVHPIIMGALFALSGYAALLGLEWRELRTAGGALRLA
jgi:hypothetical protein